MTADDAVDISGMPKYTPDDGVDISGMPKYEPEPKNPMDFTGNETPEEAELKANVGAGEVGAAVITGGLASIPAGLNYLARSAVHGVGALLGYSAFGGDPEGSRRVSEWLARKHAEDNQSFNDILNFWSYAPRTEQAQRVLQLPGEAASAAAHAVLPENAAETALEVGGDVLRGVSAVPTLKAIPKIPGAVAAARATEAARAVEPAAVAPKPRPAAAVTADQLRSQPNPIPPPNVDAATAPSTLAVQKPKITPRAGESAQAAAERQGIIPPAAPEASSAPAPGPATAAAPLGQTAMAVGERVSMRLFHPPQEDGPQYATKATDADQTARRSTLDDLNRLGGGVMTHDRRGAVTGDWYETGNEHETAKIPDAPGQLIRDQIGTENRALHNAAQGAAESVGSDALNNVDRDTLEQRGATVRGAVHAIEDHLNGAANGLYQSARAVMGDRPMASMPRVQGILSDASHDVNPTAASLRRAAQTKLQQLWSVGDTRGNVRTQPGTVGAAERFHEFLNDSFHNDSASLVRRLKNATDLDVAERAGGNDLFQVARNVIQHRETLLEPDGVNELRRPRDRNRIDHDVPLHEVMDHVLGQDREHFEHFMNVLRAGAHLSPDVAEKSAAAIREIQGHAIAKLHTAARGEAGAWNANGFYKTANRFSTNLPEAFKENPSVLSQLQTINRAGNILKMDKSYPGAVAQAAKVGLLPKLAEKGIKAVGTVGTVGGAAHGNLILAGASHLAQKAATTAAEKFVANRRLAAAQESLIPRNPKERGSVRVLANNASGESAASQEAINRGTRDIVKVDRDGNVSPVLRDVTQVDQHAKAGEVHVDRATGEITSRAPEMNRAQAEGLRNRAVGLGTLKISKTQQGKVRVMNEPEKEPATINVGLHVGDPSAGGRVMSDKEALAGVRAAGGNVTKHTVVQSNTEPTLVADLKRPFAPQALHDLSQRLQQGAIVQRHSDGSGLLAGPQAADWGGAYNPDYFRMHDGRTATEHTEDAKYANETSDVHPKSTVKSPQRSAFPGIYDDPQDIMSRVKTAPEDPILRDLFGVTRKDLHDVALSRGDVAPKTIPGVKETERATGSRAAKNVTTPENADRIKKIISAFKDHDESAYRGMVGWYVMDPLHKAVENILGKGKAADAVYSRLNTFIGMASPGSDVATEINRGTAAHMMAQQGKFEQFARYGGNPTTRTATKKAPELANVKGHPYHSTAQGGPMRRFLETGVGAQAPKTSMYVAASERPESGAFQNKVLVGDSHFSRGVGLSDVRTAKDFSGSVSGPELADLHPWYYDHVAKPLGIPSTSAQAAQWGALSQETGVETPVGAPKLELFAQQVAKAAKRLGVTPQEALVRIIKGTAHAG